MDQKKLKIAYHETGHAVMAIYCRQKVQEVSLKGMDSPIGTDKYHAFMKLEAIDPTIKYTGEKAVQKIMISLGGYASEILFLEFANIGGDDLIIAANATEEMFQFEEFKTWVAELPVPQSKALDMIENPMVKAYLDRKIGECVEILRPIKPIIQVIAEELYKKEELTGDEVYALFDSCIQLKQEVFNK